MTLVSLPLLTLAFTLGIVPITLAAGGGGSAGGAGAQNQPANGLPLGEAGPVGSPNNPRKMVEPERPGASPVVTTGKDEAPPSKKN